MAKMLRIACSIRLDVPTNPIQVWDSFFRLSKITLDTFLTKRHNTNKFLPPSLNIALWESTKLKNLPCNVMLTNYTTLKYYSHENASS